MVSRVLSRLRILLPALALFVLLGDLTPSTAVAEFLYKPSDHSEGDPGDGVLDPAVEQPSPRAGAQKPNPVAVNTSGVWSGGWTLPLGDYFFLPLQLPGQGMVIFLPRDWLHDHASAARPEGRGHDAP